MSHDLIPTQPLVRLAMVGLGPQGCEHLRAAQRSQHVTFVAAVDASPDARTQVISAFAPLAHAVFEDISALRAMPLDGLVLALPHHAYRLVWKELLALKLPMLKEKPLARTLEEAMTFLDQAQSAQCPLQTAIQRRHHPSYRYCRDLIRQRGERILEVHAHLHLGFAQTSGQSTSDNWRNSRAQSGGGTLLDSGYHMVDLAQAMVGPFEWVASTLETAGTLTSVNGIEDRVQLWGRNAETWVAIDSWLHGRPDPNSRTGFKKSEGLLIQTDVNRWSVNREGVWLHAQDGQMTQVCQSASDWGQSMANQLDEFAKRIRTNTWNTSDLWDQLPSMRIIDQAYQQVLHF